MCQGSGFETCYEEEVIHGSMRFVTVKSAEQQGYNAQQDQVIPTLSALSGSNMHIALIEPVSSGATSVQGSAWDRQV